MSIPNELQLMNASYINHIKERSVPAHILAKWANLPDTYFFTITLPPKFYRRKLQQQLRTTRRFIYDLLAAYAQESITIAESTEKGNIHYHGIIQFRLSCAKEAHIGFTESLKDFARFDCQPVKNSEMVLKYLYKDLEKTTAMLNQSAAIIYKKTSEAHAPDCTPYKRQTLLDFIIPNP